MSGSVERMADTHDMIEAHVTWMRAGGYAKNTVEDARRLLYRLDRELPAGLAESVRDELAVWLATEGWSAETRSTYYKHMVRLYRWAADPKDPWMTEDPSVGLRRPRTQPGMPRPAELAVAHACLFETESPWRLACRLAACAGLRPFDMATLHRHNVTADNITVVGKGGKTRIVPTHPLIWEEVAPLPPGPLFLPAVRTMPADGGYVSQMTNLHLKRLGIPTTLYPLRHLFATLIQSEYRDVRVVQELLGHSSLTTTARYTQVTAPQKREAVNTLRFTDAAASSAAASDGTAGPGSADVVPRQRRRAEGVGRSVAHRGRRRLSRRLVR